MRGFSEPNRCVFCLVALETVEHMFGDCVYFQQVWQAFSNSLNCFWHWDANCMVDNLKLWSENLQRSLVVPMILMWEVWRARNTHIFQWVSFDLKRIVHKSNCYFVNSAAILVKAKPRHICDPPSLNDTVVWLF